MEILKAMTCAPHYANAPVGGEAYYFEICLTQANSSSRS